MARKAVGFTQNILETLRLDRSDVILERVQARTNVRLGHQVSELLRTPLACGSTVVMLGETNKRKEGQSSTNGVKMGAQLTS